MHTTDVVVGQILAQARHGPRDSDSARAGGSARSVSRQLDRSQGATVARAHLFEDGGAGSWPTSR